MNCPPLCRLARIAALFALLAASAAFAEDAGLDINVRTTVEAPKGKALGAHPIFAMFPAVETASEYKLIRPVPPATLAKVYQMIQEKLLAQGYVGVAGKEKPDVLITIQYGRGYLPNPYNTGMGRVDSKGTLTTSVVGLPDAQRFTPDREAKRQLANEEKLFFTVAAMDFATMQKDRKPVIFWTTTMFVDDPDHRDLNQIYRQMIAAGSEFFNKRLDREEVEISTNLREGRVEVGVPRVVEDPKAKK